MEDKKDMEDLEKNDWVVATSRLDHDLVKTGCLGQFEKEVDGKAQVCFSGKNGTVLLLEEAEFEVIGSAGDLPPREEVIYNTELGLMYVAERHKCFEHAEFASDLHGEGSNIVREGKCTLCEADLQEVFIPQGIWDKERETYIKQYL